MRSERLTTNDWRRPIPESRNLFYMLRYDKIRRWRRMGLSSLLCLSIHSFAAQTETSAPATKPADASAAPAAKATHPSNAHATAKHTPSRTSSHSSAQKGKSARGKKVAKKRGQQAIDSDRARQIQTALIREHYMQGAPTGTWDSATQAAMQRYQADQGWQSKQIPDSRALIKLGLGPSHDHLLNPESAMTSTPAAGDPKAAAQQAPAQNHPPQQ